MLLNYYTRDIQITQVSENRVLYLILGGWNFPLKQKHRQTEGLIPLQWLGLSEQGTWASDQSAFPLCSYAPTIRLTSVSLNLLNCLAGFTADRRTLEPCAYYLHQRRNKNQISRRDIILLSLFEERNLGSVFKNTFSVPNILTYTAPHFHLLTCSMFACRCVCCGVEQKAH